MRCPEKLILRYNLILSKEVSAIKPPRALRENFIRKLSEIPVSVTDLNRFKTAKQRKKKTASILFETVCALLDFQLLFRQFLD